MPIPVNVSRVSLIGAGPGGEIFDTSFWLSGQAPQSEVIANAQADAIGDLLNDATLDTLRGWIAGPSAYQELRLYSYPDGGPVASYIGVRPLTAGIGNAAGRNVPQACVVVSLRTGFAGRRNRGRMYLPANGMPAGSDHQFAAANVATLAAAMGSFFSDVNALTDVGNVSVVSQAGAAGGVTPVTSIIVDTKVDIQRRRADAIVPTASSVIAVA